MPPLPISLTPEGTDRGQESWNFFRHDPNEARRMWQQVSSDIFLSQMPAHLAASCADEYP
jgi:hypothetical protein